MEQQTQQPNQPFSQEKPAGKSEKNIGMAIIAYILFFIPLLTDAKNDPFVKYHVKQGLAFFLTCIVVFIARSLVPWYYWWSMGWIFWILNIGLLVLWILGIINAANGKENPLPLIGKLGEKFKF